MALVIAHRGASAAHPENTLEAFAGAAVLGADWVELDVRPTADGELVVHHDAHLGDGRAIVGLRGTQLPGTVCTLAEALDVCAEHHLGVNIEIKCLPGEPDEAHAEATVAAVAALLDARRGAASDAGDGLLITSFLPSTVDRSRELVSWVPTGQLTLALDDGPDMLRSSADRGHRAVHPWDPGVDEAYVRLAHDLGLEVNVWTVDDPQRMAQLIAFGVDGIITNVPDVARDVVGAS